MALTYRASKCTQSFSNAEMQLLNVEQSLEIRELFCTELRTISFMPESRSERD